MYGFNNKSITKTYQLEHYPQIKQLQKLLVQKKF